MPDTQKLCMYCMQYKETEEAKCPHCGQKIDEAAVPPHHLYPGVELNNKYIVGRALGEGGFGITYIGRDKNLDMRVAIKEYYPSGFVNRNSTNSSTITANVGNSEQVFIKGREKFINEARILAKFAMEPGIVGVRDFFETNNTAYIVMDFLDGITLKEYLEKNGVLSLGQILELLNPVLKALERIHAKELIHRDISPDNLMLTDGGLKLLDFGAARDVGNLDQKSLSVMLKPGYAPEEQYRSKGIQGPWTDIYALCATIYKCITGITPEESLNRAFNDELKTPSSLGIAIAAEQEEALMKGMALLHKNRIQNIQELREQLYVKGSVINNKQQSASKPAQKPVAADPNATVMGQAYEAKPAQRPVAADPNATVMGQAYEAKPAQRPVAADPNATVMGQAYEAKPAKKPVPADPNATVMAEGPYYTPSGETPVPVHPTGAPLPPKSKFKIKKKIMFISGAAVIAVIATSVILFFTLRKTDDDHFKIENNRLIEYTGPSGRVELPPLRFRIIGTSAFSNKGITRVTIPNGVTTIGASAFVGNKITSIVIPESVRNIAQFAFADNPITKITIGYNVEIHRSAFDIEFFNLYNSTSVRKMAGTYVKNSNGTWSRE